MGKAAPVTTLCGQLAALKTQTFRVKAEEKKVSLSQEQSSKHSRCAEREHLCFTKVLAQSSRPEPYLVERKCNAVLPAMTKRTLSQAGNCKVSHK